MSSNYAVMGRGSTGQAHAHRAAAGHKAFGGDAGTLLRKGIDAIRRWHRARRTIRELRQLDARMLRDIGLDRSAIEVTALGLARRYEAPRPRHF